MPHTVLKSPLAGVIEPWLGILVTLAIFAHAMLWANWVQKIDWVDVAGEGFVLVTLLAAYQRATRSALAPGVRITLQVGLLLMTSAAAADWIEEFYPKAPFLHLLENLGLIAGGPCLLYALNAVDKNRDLHALRLQHQAEHFENMALRDALTEVGNRHAFDLFLSARASKGGFAFLLLDLDHFKRINDEHGHNVGDEILRLTGGLLKSLLRDGDYAYRYGGEEFALIVVTNDPRQAYDIAERLRLGFARLDHPVLDQGRRAGAYGTLSVGFAMAVPKSNAAALIMAADRALYRAKTVGRNRVEAG